MHSHTVTYSPEDNKLRLYIGYVPRAEYETLRKAGFVATPKQDCDFAATWTPSREDLAREYLEDDEDIGDEDYSPLERASDRAERFSGYRDKRAGEAVASADVFDSGPAAFGHQSQARAERQARRHDRHRTYAASQWSKAEYWQQRTEGVIANALYKSSPAVRRGRILTLEAELRQVVANYTPTENPPTAIMQQVYDYQAGKYLYDGASVPHVCVGPKGRCGRWQEVSALEGIKAGSARWENHLQLRLKYERAMLAAEGGTVAEVEMEPGGWINTGNRTGHCLTDVSVGWKQVQAVTRSPVTKRVVSVKIWGTWTGFSRESKYTQQVTESCLVTVNIERLGENAYRAPTDEERAQFATATKERKAAEKATKPASPPLINPTDEDAQRLQDHWNARAAALHAALKAKHKLYSEFIPATVRRMTQAGYAAASKGSYSHCETTEVCEHGFQPARQYGARCDDSPTAFKVRQCPFRDANGDWHQTSPHCVIVLTDKPQKPLPLDWTFPASVPVEETAEAEAAQYV